MFVSLIGGPVHTDNPENSPLSIEAACILCPSKLPDAFAYIVEGSLRVHLLDSEESSLWPDKNCRCSKAAFGWDHAVIIGTEGTVYAQGWNWYGQVAPQQSGTQRPDVYIVHWREVPQPSFGSKIVQVAAGEHHSLALSALGDVFAWGSNSDFQLGLQEGQDASKPQCVFGPATSYEQQGRYIACGARHSCVVTAGGGVFCWGWSLHGQCASSSPSATRPTLVQELRGVEVGSVAAGLAHTLALSCSGDVYSWGWNGDGQLGLGDQKNRFSPELVELGDTCGDSLLSVSKISCGARHSAALASTGELFCSGYNKHGEIGQAEDCDLSKIFVPLRKSIKDVECGWWHTAVVMEGEVDCRKEGAVPK